MRPQKLTMQAFGSYGKYTEISFEEPNQKSLSDYGRYRIWKNNGI